MRVIRLYTGADRRSHFEEVQVPYGPQGAAAQTAPLPVAGGLLRRATRPLDYFHTAPRRQYFVMTEGRIEIEVGDGTRQLFAPGDICLVEDTEGEGHIVHILGEEPWGCLFLPVAE